MAHSRMPFGSDAPPIWCAKVATKRPVATTASYGPLRPMTVMLVGCESLHWRASLKSTRSGPVRCRPPEVAAAEAGPSTAAATRATRIPLSQRVRPSTAWSRRAIAWRVRRCGTPRTATGSRDQRQPQRQRDRGRAEHHAGLGFRGAAHGDRARLFDLDGVIRHWDANRAGPGGGRCRTRQRQPFCRVRDSGVPGWGARPCVVRGLVRGHSGDVDRYVGFTVGDSGGHVLARQPWAAR